MLYCQVTSFCQAAGRVSSSEVWTLHQSSASAHQHRHQADCAAYSTVCEGDNILTVDTPHLLQCDVHHVSLFSLTSVILCARATVITLHDCEMEYCFYQYRAAVGTHQVPTTWVIFTTRRVPKYCIEYLRCCIHLIGFSELVNNFE